jgi:hypothetical protein
MPRRVRTRRGSSDRAEPPALPLPQAYRCVDGASRRGWTATADGADAVREPAGDAMAPFLVSAGAWSPEPVAVVSPHAPDLPVAPRSHTICTWREGVAAGTRGPRGGLSAQKDQINVNRRTVRPKGAHSWRSTLGGVSPLQQPTGGAAVLFNREADDDDQCDGAA